MSEDVWLSVTRAITLLKLTKGRTTDRKLRLFACGRLYTMRHLIVGDATTLLDAVEAAATADELRRIRRNCPEMYWIASDRRLRGRLHHVDSYPCGLAATVTDANARNAARRSLGYGYEWAHQQEAMLAREVFGNPFRPIDFAPWHTDTTVALAKGMYESRDFSAMPILADALQDAGCDNADVLIHCRDASAEHVRGCWVVDGVLGLA
ncbi:hypothetical protein R5W23_000503 [Gemmata sp. JC673]|uniref:Uncharacterized protein n=1 Tax=Gemmata algarum TaxID=2975278 RepID=A0ABU5EWB6_9BACT|nr:hypothetical protein [Gemmata algarum]MDY3559510.1 hypothetical protein [Gemmata algarum]